MTEIKQDQKLMFPFDTEYTIDGGASWTTLAANTEAIIPSDDLDAGGRKVTVRSADVNATTMIGSDFGKDTVSFDEINIRNARLMTDMPNAFESAIIGRLHINNIQELSNLEYMCKNAVIDEVVIGEIPKATTARNVFAGGYFGYIGKIDAGRLSLGCSFDTMFYQATVGVFSGKTIKNSLSGIVTDLSSGTIDAMGHMDISTISSGSMSSHALKYAFYSGRADYLPSVSYVNNGATELTTTSAYVFYGFNQGIKTYIPSMRLDFSRALGSSSTDAMLYNSTSSLVFGGINAKVNAGNDTNIFSSTPSVDTATRLISSINATYGNSTDANVSAALGVTTGKRYFYKNENWFPHIEFLDVELNSTYIGTSSAGPRGLGYIVSKELDSNIDIYAAKKYKAPRNITISNDIEYTIADSNTPVFCRNGYIAYNTGSDIKIVNKDQIELSTISGKQITKGQFSADGLKLYIVLGGEVDKSGTSGQQIESTIEVYDTQDGTKIGDTISIPLGTDEWVAGIYQKDDNYGLKAVVNVWFVDPEDSVYKFKEVRVDSYEPSGTAELRKTIVTGSGECTYVMQDFFESNEFAIVDAVAGTVQRVVGK